MSPLTTDDLRLIFDNLDKNRDGLLSLEELSWLLERIGYQPSRHELELSFGKPSLDFGEFLVFYQSIGSFQDSCSGRTEDIFVELEGDHHEEVADHETDLAEAFGVFDLNGDGFISSEELQDVLSRLGLWDERSGRDCRRMINAYDTNRDGRLDFEEFKNMMFLTISS